MLFGIIRRTQTVDIRISGSRSVSRIMLASAGNTSPLLKRLVSPSRFHIMSHPKYKSERGPSQRSLGALLAPRQRWLSPNLLFARKQWQRSRFYSTHLSRWGCELDSRSCVLGSWNHARDGMLGLCDWENELVAVFETNEEGPMHIKCVTSPGI